MRTIIFFGFLAFLCLGTPSVSRAVDMDSFTPSPTAIKLSSLPDEDCTSATVAAIPIRVYSKEPSILYVDRQQVMVNSQLTFDFGNQVVVKPNHKIYKCEYSLQIKDGPEGTSPELWFSEVYGNGQVFFDGYWHPDNLTFDDVTFFDQVHLSNKPKNEMLLYHVSCGEDGCGSFLKIYSFNDIFKGNTITLLTFSDAGLMTYSFSNGVLTVKGCTPPPGGFDVPGQCQVKKTVSVFYERDIQKVAIKNPTPNNEEFFTYLTRTDQ